MATLMQKDALLEGVFQALGYVINKNPNSKDRRTFIRFERKNILLCSRRIGF